MLNLPDTLRTRLSTVLFATPRCLNLLVVAAFCVVLLTLFSVNLSAAVFTVSKIADTNDGTCDADCSLREAVVAMNGAGVGPHTIDFDGIVFAGSQTISLTLGELAITTAETVTITGTGADILTISGSGTSRVFSNSGDDATISGLSIIMGNGVGTLTTGFGGGVFNSGGLTLNMVAISGNSSQVGGNGGGIYNIGGGVLTITSSTIDNNTGDTGGGGILNFVGGTVTMNNSTVYNNNVPTLSNGGGGIANVGTFTANSITVSSNTAPLSAGGGVVNFGTFNSQNSIYGDNTSASNPDFSGVLTSQNYNLIEDITGTTISLFENRRVSRNESKKEAQLAANDITGVDPVLLPFGNYTGTTNTQPPAVGSPTLDQGNSGALTTDQRGHVRPVDIPSLPNAAGGNAADIGAVERLAVTAADVTISGRVMTSSGRGVFGASVTMSTLDGSIRTAVTNNFGYYRFSNVGAGQTLIFSVRSKQYTFLDRAENIFESRSDINFVAVE